jgi:hypothetical protein
MNTLKTKEKKGFEGSQKYVIYSKKAFEVKECHVSWDLD